MKIKDYISKTIQEYPSLYKCETYEESKLKVLDQIFFTIGNGLEMADTYDPKQGGYVVEPNYKKDEEIDEWVRIKDKPYGKVKHKPIPEGYFESAIYYIYGHDRPIETICKEREYGGSDIYFRYGKGAMKPMLFEVKSEHPFQPYPFSKGCSIACDVFYDDVFLQADWMEELIILCRRTLEFFKDQNQYKNDSYYPSDQEIKRDLIRFENIFKEEGQKGLTHLRKIWCYEAKDTVPDYAEIEARKWQSWTEYHKNKQPS